MSLDSDPTDAIRTKAAAFPAVAPGTSCNQSAFRVGKRAFLYIGPGAKGRGFKAMFKLDQSMPGAMELATTQPDRFEVGSTGGETTRFPLRVRTRSEKAVLLRSFSDLRSLRSARDPGSDRTLKSVAGTTASDR